jgi:hypothetical protein
LLLRRKEAGQSHVKGIDHIDIQGTEIKQTEVKITCGEPENRKLISTRVRNTAGQMDIGRGAKVRTRDQRGQ